MRDASDGEDDSDEEDLTGLTSIKLLITLRQSPTTPRPRINYRPTSYYGAESRHPAPNERWYTTQDKKSQQQLMDPLAFPPPGPSWTTRVSPGLEAFTFPDRDRELSSSRDVGGGTLGSGKRKTARKARTTVGDDSRDWKKNTTRKARTTVGAGDGNARGGVRLKETETLKIGGVEITMTDGEIDIRQFRRSRDSSRPPVLAALRSLGENHQAESAGHRAYTLNTQKNSSSTYMDDSYFEGYEFNGY